LLANIFPVEIFIFDLKEHLNINKKQIPRKKYKIMIFTGISLNKGFPS